MITRPLDVASKLRPEPRNFDVLFYVNAGLIALFFTLCGSRFILAPGLGVDFQVPVLSGAIAGSATTDRFISVLPSGQIFADGLVNMKPAGGVAPGGGQEIAAALFVGPRERRCSDCPAHGDCQCGPGSWFYAGGLGSRRTRCREGQNLWTMKASAGAWKLWLFSTGGSLVVILLLVSLFRVPVSTPGPANRSSANAVLPRVELAAHEDELLIEEMALRDPTPLFLPTVWNAAEDALAMNAPREPGGSFQDYAPFYTFDVNRVEHQVPEHVERVRRDLPDALALDSASRLLFGFGQIDGTIEPLQPRRGFLEVVSASDGQILMRQPLIEGSSDRAREVGNPWSFSSR